MITNLLPPIETVEQESARAVLSIVDRVIQARTRGDWLSVDSRQFGYLIGNHVAPFGDDSLLLKILDVVCNQVSCDEATVRTCACWIFRKPKEKWNVWRIETAANAMQADLAAMKAERANRLKRMHATPAMN